MLILPFRAIKLLFKAVLIANGHVLLLITMMDVQLGGLGGAKIRKGSLTLLVSVLICNTVREGIDDAKKYQCNLGRTFCRFC